MDGPWEEKVSTCVIQELPDVILEYIFTQLTPYNQLRTCRLVCRHWYHVANSALYRLRLDFHSSLRTMELEWNRYTPIRGPSISGRFSHATCIHKNLMYISGGCTNGNTTFNDLWTFDLDKRSWTRPLISGQYPPPKACASLTRYKNKLILFGGWTHSTPYPYDRRWRLFNHLHEFDLKTNRWTEIITTGGCPPMAGHNVSLVGDRLILFGGLCSGLLHYHYQPQNNVWVYDLEGQYWARMNTSNERPPARYGHSQILVDEEHLLVIGGSGGPDVFFNDIWLLNLNTWTWQCVQVNSVSREPYQFPVIGYNPVVRVENTLVFLTKGTNAKLHTTATKPTTSRRLRHYAAYFNSQSNDGPSVGVNRLQPQPSQAERKSNFLAALELNRSDEEAQQENNEADENRGNMRGNDGRNHPREGDASGRVKNLQSSAAIKLATIRNGNWLSAQNPMQLHLLDISKVTTDLSVNWLNHTRRLDGPEELLHYTLLAATNEIVLFGGMSKMFSDEANFFADNILDVISNNVYILSAKQKVI